MTRETNTARAAYGRPFCGAGCEDMDRDEKGAVVALGTFDGLHRGHEAVLLRAVREAKERGLTAAAYTFRSSPKNLCGEKVRQLMSPEEKERRMRELGIERVVDVEFTDEIRGMSPRAFASMLARDLHARAVVTGQDYRFGRGAQGDAAMLRELGRGFGFDAIVVDTVMCGGEKLSSTMLRRALPGPEDGT